MRNLTLSTADDILVFMASNVDHITGVEGATLSVALSKAAGAFNAIVPSVVERGSGWYALSLIASMVDTLGDLGFHVTAPGCDPADWHDRVVAYDPGDAVALGLSRLDADVGSRLSAVGYTAPDNAGIEAAIAGVPVALLAALYDGLHSMASALVTLRAFMAGKTTGHPSHPIHYGPDGTTPILEADVDADGNRSSVNAHGG